MSFSFCLNPSSCNIFYGVIACFARISETVSFEARRDYLTISTLNISKTLHAAVSFEPTFFADYSYSSSNEKLTFAVANKSLLPIFKLKISGGDSRSKISLERCEVTIDNDFQGESRFIAHIHCHHAISKIYKLTYETVDVMHAVFEKTSPMSTWTIKSSILRENLDFFSPRVEQLDLFYYGEHMNFLSFTTKLVTDKKEVLKQPLKTTVHVNKADFIIFEVKQDLHVVISVKDFKTVVLHADSIDADLRAFYTKPSRPLQFTYEKPGFICKFTLMTASYASSGVLVTASKKSLQSASCNRAAPPHQPLASALAPPTSRSRDARRSTQTLGRRHPDDQLDSHGEKAVSQSLFFPLEADDDEAWDPTNYEPSEEMLTWDPRGGLDESFFAEADHAKRQAREAQHTALSTSGQGLPPTQRISQIRRIFDEAEP